MKKDNYKPISKKKYVLNLVLNFIWNILKYPFRVKDKYRVFNEDIYLMHSKTRLRSLEMLRKRNERFIQFLIVIPLFVGIIGTSLMIYKEKEKYITYYKTLTLPIKGEGFFEKTGNTFKRGYGAVKYQPFSFEELQFVIYGYLFILIGAKFLEMNPLFIHAKRIEKFLLELNKTNDKKEAWKVVYTPDALLIKAHLEDVEHFKNQKRFWDQIEFRPSEDHKTGRNNMEFIFIRRYQLPTKVIFNIGELT